MTKAITALILAMAFLMPACAAEMSVEELRAEYQKRFAEAAQSKDAGEWAKVEEWIESRQRAAPQGEPWGSVFREWKDRVGVETVCAELKALSPDDQAGLLALADQQAKGRPGEDRIREALAAYVKSHPLDAEIYQRCLAELEGTARFQAHFARSDGWMALAEKEKDADQFYQAGQWHETVPEAECNQAPVRAIRCYAKAMRLAPDEPRYREALDQWLKQIIPAPIHAAEINQAPPEGKGLIPTMEPRPPLVTVENYEVEDQARQGNRFKVESKGRQSYSRDAPITNQGIEQVWELWEGRQLEEVGTGGRDPNGLGHPAGIAKDRAKWVRLQWDEANGEWVAYPQAPHRRHLKEGLARLEGEIDECKKRIPELEAALKKSLQPENLVERAGHEIGEEAAPQEANAFLLRLLEERRERKRMLEALLTYRASLTISERKAREFQAELLAVERRGKQRTVSLASRISIWSPFPPWMLLAGGVVAGGLVGAGYWRKKNGGKPVARKSKAKAAPAKEEPPAPSPAAIDKAVPSKA